MTLMPREHRSAFTRALGRQDGTHSETKTNRARGVSTWPWEVAAYQWKRPLDAARVCLICQ